MAYTNRPTDSVTTERTISNNVAVEYRDRVRWGPIISGLVVALATQLVLSALGAALGFSTIANSGAPRSNADDVGTAVGIWSIISLFISLFVGGWVTARACGYINRNTALLNGAILWATTLAISAWLLASGVSGAFGLVAANTGTIVNQAQRNGVTVPDVQRAITNNPSQAGTPDAANPQQNQPISAQQTRDIANNGAKVGWSFTFGALLGLLASMVGASLGARTAPRSLNNNM